MNPLTVYMMSNDNSKSISKEYHNLKGMVFFKGAKCNTNSIYFKTPPCSGIYPNYAIVIYLKKDNKETEIDRIKTDSDGSFKTFLKPGQYVIYTEYGKPPSKKV